MKRINHNGLVYFRFGLFDPYPELAHGAFTRAGGVSPPPYEGLNLGFVPGDDEANVRKNRDLAAEALGFEQLASVGQVHEDRTLVVRAEEGLNPRCRGEAPMGFDALITSDPGVGLMVSLGDCQGVLLYDPETGALGVVHSGWRGSVRNVLGRTVERMVEEFNVRPSDLLAGIGPSLGPCCAEFINYKTELPESFHDYRHGLYFDFWAISRDQLTAAGLRPDRIEVSGICTKCGTEGFFSYRRNKVGGRFGLIAGRREV